MSDMITVTEAARRLGHRRTARFLAQAGLLGPVTKVQSGRGVSLVDGATVDGLAARPVVRGLEDLSEPVRQVIESTYLFVERLDPWAPDPEDPSRPGMGYHASRSGTADQHQAIAGYWWVNEVTTEAWINEVREQWGGLPLVVTVAGLVAECWKILRVADRNEVGKARFEIVPPGGAWADELVGKWLPSGGGGPWAWWPGKKAGA